MIECDKMMVDETEYPVTEDITFIKLEQDVNKTGSKKAQSCSSKLKVCRFCLATKVKMFSLDNEVLKACIDGLGEQCNVDGLPPYLCYICTAYLLKIYNVIEKSTIAQASFKKIYSESPEVNERNIIESRSKELNLAHTLQSHNETPCKVYEYVYDENLNTSILTATKLQSDRCEDAGGSEDMIDSEVDITERKLSECEDLLTNTFCKPIEIDKGTSKKCDNSKVTHQHQHINVTKVKNKDRNEKLLVQEHDGARKRSNELDNNILDTNTNKKILVQEQNISQKGSNESFNIEIKNRKNKVLEQKNKIVNIVNDNVIDNVSFKCKNGMFSFDNDHDYLRVYTVDKSEVTDISVKGTTPPAIVAGNKIKRRPRCSKRNNYLKVADVETLREDETIPSTKPSNDIEGSNMAVFVRDPVPNDDFRIMRVLLREQREQWSRTVGLRGSHDSAAWRQCAVCGLWLSGAKYGDHVATHDPINGAHECEVCKERYHTADSLEKHMEMKHAWKYVCKVCPKICYTLESARLHGLQHRRRALHCALCQLALPSRPELLRHVASEHADALTIPKSTQIPPETDNVWGKKYFYRQTKFREKRIIYNIFKHFEKNSVTYPYRSQLCKITAQIAGISAMSAQRIVIPLEQEEEAQPKATTSDSQPEPTEIISLAKPGSRADRPTSAETIIIFSLYKHLEKASVANLVKEDLYKTTARITGFSVDRVCKTIRYFEEVHRKRRENKIRKKKESKACAACGARLPTPRARRLHLAVCPGAPPKEAPVSDAGNTSASASEERGKVPTRRSTRLKQKKKEMPPIEVGYECPTCGKSFKTTRLLKLHMKVHPQIKSEKDYSEDEDVNMMSSIDIKEEKIRDDSQTETASEGEELNNQEMARSLKDPLSNIYFWEDE